jgi:hypothetical protein
MTLNYLRAKNNFGWSSAASVFYASDSSLPSAPVTTGGSRCQAGVVTLYSNDAADRWYTALTGGTPFHTGSSYSASFSTTTTYYVEAITAFNCISATRSAVTATVDAQSNGGTLSQSAQVFDNASGTLSLSGHAGNVQKWQSKTETGSWEDISNTTASQPYNISATTDYRVWVKNGVCDAITSNEVSIVIHSLPTVTASTNRIEMEPVNLDAGPGYSSYTWKNSSNVTVGGSQTYNATIPGNYTVTVTKAGVTGSGTSTPFTVLAQFDGVNKNYILSRTPMREIKDVDKLAVLPIDSVTQSIQYFDGLGRPIQSVIIQGSPDKKDIVQPIVYDQFGREAVKYLPYVSTEANGWYKQNALTHQSNFYDPNTPTPKVAADVAPFAVTVFEPSPLNRIIKLGAPGTDWQPDDVNTYNSTDHTIKKAYEFNEENEVLLWTYTYPTAENPFGMVSASNGTTPVYYPPNQLFKNRTKDEHGNEVIEYVDKQNRTILKRVQAVSGSPAINDSTYASTYFVFNHHNKPVCIIPPEASKSITKTNSEFFGKSDGEKNNFLKRWAYRYAYDGRQRLTKKQLPGAEPVYMVHDKRDRMVMTQDGNQRSENKWLFTKYDAINRPIITGIYTHNNEIGQAEMSALISTTNFFDSYNGNASFHGYTNNVFPTTNANSSPLEILTVTYYDNYQFRDDLAGSNYNFVTNDIDGQPEIFTRVTGLVTGAKVNILNTTDYLWSVNYYDDKYRTIQTIAQNHKGGIDRITNKLDFVGKVLESKTTHNNSTDTYTIKRRIEYDHGQRPLKTWHKVNDKPEVLLSVVEYNALSEPVVKKLHSTDSVTFKQHIDYRYNIRSWLTRINNSNLAPDNINEPRDFFGMNLVYNDVLAGISNTAQYNGNISAMKWSTNAGLGFNDTGLEIFEPTERGYKFTYDPMNRLTASTHVENTIGWNSTTAFLETLSYNLHGSTTALTRKGIGGINMDVLSYTYNGNQVLTITDAANTEEGFKDGNTSGNDFDYDDNGNTIFDKNKDITSIVYNHLNLPASMTKNTGERIEYGYDATANKITQTVFSSTNVLTSKTDYVGEFIYENDTLQFIQQEEGRIVPEENGDFTYDYVLKDHLGNTRITFTTKPKTETFTATFEDNTVADEQLNFNNYSRLTNDLLDHTDAGNIYDKVLVLNGGYNGQIGLAKSFAVVPGDTIKAKVYAKYLSGTGGTGNLANFAAAITGAFGLTSTMAGEAGTMYETLNSFGGIIAGGGREDDENAPKGFINILVFDKNFNLVDFSYQQLDAAYVQTGGTKMPHQLLTAQSEIRHAGYAFVFLSNENPTEVQIGFDDFEVAHIHSSVIQQDEYFSYGAPLPTSYSVEGSLENKWKYSNKEHIFNLGLDLADYGARFYDFWGRPSFTAIDPHAENYYSSSPYVYALTNPVLLKDDDGKDIIITNLSASQQKQLAQFAKTNEGRAFLSQFAVKGKEYTIGGEKFTFDVKQSSNHNVYYQTRDLSSIKKDGLTETYIWSPIANKYVKTDQFSAKDAKSAASHTKGQFYNFWVTLDDDLTTDRTLYGIAHESFVHIDQNRKELDKEFRDYKSGAITERMSNFKGNTPENALSSFIVASAYGPDDHKLLVNGKVVNLERFVKELDKLFKTTKFSEQYIRDKKFHEENPSH